MESERPPKRRIDPNWVLAMGAVGISFLALWVSLYEVSIMRREERAQVWPYVDISLSYGSDGLSIRARNKGTGPALVGQMSVRVDGRRYQEWEPLLNDLLGPDHGIGYDTLMASSIGGEVMSADEVVVLFNHPWNDRIRTLASRMEAAVFEVCYCSIHEECWQVNGKKREVVNACPGAPTSRSE